MWAQLITARVKADHVGGLGGLSDLLQASEQPGSGLIRETIMQDQNDPSRVYVLAIFESEEKARARESDPRREEPLADLRRAMGDILDGVPEFVDLTVFKELTV
jgi:hypothetical protein